MTYAETSKLVAAINDVETWAGAARAEMAKPYEDFDLEAYNRYNRYLESAKQAVFNLASK